MIDTVIGMVLGIVIFVAGMATQRLFNQPLRTPLFTKSASSSSPVIEYDPYEDALQDPKVKGRNTVE